MQSKQRACAAWQPRPIVKNASGGRAQCPRVFLHKGGFIGRRWRGEVPLAVLYWRDMLAVGSFINLLTGFAALMLAARGVDLRLAAVVHFAIVPYNAFLVAALWRTPGRTKAMAWTSLVWLIVMTLF
jgi:hypothetical protein